MKSLMERNGNAATQRAAHKISKDKEPLQGIDIDPVPMVHLLRGGLRDVRQVNPMPDVGQDLALWSRKDGTQRPAKEHDHRDVVFRDGHPQSPETRESVIRLRLPECVHRMQPVAILQAILDKTFPAPDHATLFAELEGDGILETAWNQGHRLTLGHELLHLRGRLDGPILSPVRVAEHSEEGVFMPQPGIDEPIHTACCACEDWVEGPIDCPTCREATMWMEGVERPLRPQVAQCSSDLCS
eukprot:CAMPEP_0115657448 /NCGR_PEP_ID=MMETSP0272-20121206/44691_1 /TAXON_ID=71861 /ORGANISM="Scrippsiella trochoidea, Strain CCMP3099" /LENGTH=241 /DNA_ID=CAMNT_0003095487 /DNA_START=56 /DNA_END=781 /DNA_ORIENTATION=+